MVASILQVTSFALSCNAGQEQSNRRHEEITEDFAESCEILVWGERDFTESNRSTKTTGAVKYMYIAKSGVLKLVLAPAPFLDLPRDKTICC